MRVQKLGSVILGNHLKPRLCIHETMSTEFDREIYLKDRLNTFLSEEFNLPISDYYSLLSLNGFIQLKSILSDINNIITLKVTLSFVDGVATKFNLDKSEKINLIKKVLSQKPNSNGFDLWLTEPIAFAAEIKCNIPINKGKIYGSQQRAGIEKDILNLINGKRKSYINSKLMKKFMVFLDLPEIREANEHLLKTNDFFRNNVIFVDDSKKFHRINVVYGIYVAI